MCVLKVRGVRIVLYVLVREPHVAFAVMQICFLHFFTSNGRLITFAVVVNFLNLLDCYPVEFYLRVSTPSVRAERCDVRTGRN